MSKEFLRSLKETFEDIPRAVYNQTKLLLKSDEGVLIDLTCHYNLKEWGSNRDQRMIMEGDVFYAPQTLLKALSEEVCLIKSQDLNLDYDPEDYSRLLSLRRNLPLICLFEDAEYSFQFLDKNKNPVSTVFYLDQISETFFNLSGLANFLKIKEEKASVMSYRYEYLSHGHERVIRDSYRVLNRLVITRGVNDHTFGLLKEMLSKNPPVPEWDFSSPENFLRTWSTTRKSHFSHWDFYDWSEIIFSFSIQGDFSAYKKARRIRDRWTLSSLMDKGVISLNLKSKRKEIKAASQEEETIP